MNHNQELGRRGEDAAAQWYQTSGYSLLERNWRCRDGEIDLIVARDDTVVFVEVKTRSSARYGSGFDAVTQRKRRTIRRVARRWLARQDRWVSDLRFDVVDVDRLGRIRVEEGCF